MPLVPLSIAEESEEELRVLCEQPLDRLEAAYARAAAVKEHFISPGALRTAMNGALPPIAVRALIRQLVGLRSFIDEAQVTPSEAIEALSAGLKQKHWPEGIFHKWVGASKVLERFLSLENIITIAKALELSLDFEHVHISSKILTDVRPIFSATRNEIIGGIVCNRLRIRYHDEDAHRSISISIDKDEIEYLQKLCREALRKIELASGLLKTAGLSSFITGEGYDDFA
jgi:hypothetical protein